jgi:hypothetical protein
MIRSIADGIPELGPFLFFVKKHPRCDEMLQWLIATERTGHALEKWMFIECNRSIKRTIAEILSRIDKEKRVRSAVAKNYTL